MSWHYSQELEGAFLPPSICSDIGLSAPSKTRASARKSSCKDSATDSSPASPSGTMQKPSTENLGEGTSTSSAPVSHVLRGRVQVFREGQTMSEIFGTTQCESFARFDPESSTLRTYPDLFPVDISSLSSKTLPKHGMMLGGVCYLLPRPWWAATIYASGGGAERPWLESDAEDNPWPTPRACEGSNPPMGKEKKHHGLTKVVKDNPFPTPTMMDGRRKGKACSYEEWLKRFEELKKRGVNLHYNLNVAVDRFPTPTAGDSKASGAAGYSTASGRHSGTTLTDKVVRSANSETPREEESWPTPAATDGKGSGKTGEPRDRLDYAVERGETKTKVYDKPPPGGGQLSADWTDWLVGFPILWSSPDPLPVSAVQEWLAITLLHDWWAEEPPIPRTIERGGDKHRCRRLKGIGNAQVPLCAAVAYTILEIQQEA